MKHARVLAGECCLENRKSYFRANINNGEQTRRFCVHETRVSRCFSVLPATGNHATLFPNRFVDIVVRNRSNKIDKSFLSWRLTSIRRTRFDVSIQERVASEIQSGPKVFPPLSSQTLFFYYVLKICRKEELKNIYNKG